MNINRFGRVLRIDINKENIGVQVYDRDYDNRLLWVDGFDFWPARTRRHFIGNSARFTRSNLRAIWHQVATQAGLVEHNETVDRFHDACVEHGAFGPVIFSFAGWRRCALVSAEHDTRISATLHVGRVARDVAHIPTVVLERVLYEARKYNHQLGAHSASWQKDLIGELVEVLAERRRRLKEAAAA